MPILVDEVVISVEVEDRPTGEPRSSAPGPVASSTEERQALVAECVERVLEILAQKEER